MAAEMDQNTYYLLDGLSPKTEGQEKKTWAYFRKAVQEKRKLLSSLSSSVPSNFKFISVEADGCIKTRLYFLGVAPGSRENTLLYVDLPQDGQKIADVLLWKVLLSSFSATPASGILSREEQLLRERKRIALSGITAYDVHPDEGTFVFAVCNNLYVCKDLLGLPENVSPVSLNLSIKGTPLDPKLCPQNANLIAFIHENDIWITNLETGVDKRLTFAHKGLVNRSWDPHSAGVASYVIQEEFDRFTGYWWQPAPKIIGTENGTEKPSLYSILYEEVDESDVNIINIFAPSSSMKTVDEYRYPHAGTQNATCVLKLVEFEVDATGQFCDVLVEKQLYEPLSDFFPWIEYILRAGWTPCGKYIYVEIIDRLQLRLVLVLIPADCFIPVASDVEMPSFDGADYPPLTVIYEDVSSIWINIHDVLHFFPQDDDSQISFLWSSEKSGYRSLYHVTSSMKSSVAVSADGVEVSGQVQEPQVPNILHEVCLTPGDWEASGKSGQHWVDEVHNLVYFMGYKDTCLESHLYVVSYAVPGKIIRLTERDYSHSVTLNQDCSQFITVYSSINETPQSKVFKIQRDIHGQISVITSGILMEPIVCPDNRSPELFSFVSSSGDTFHGMYYKPHNYQPGVRYPTVLFVYGGPQVQLISNSFKGVKFLRLQILASQGYAVVVMDGRGSCNRGLVFESHIKNRLGTVEINDQVEGLQWLSDNFGLIDMARVAIHGWSYGGYLSLMGLVYRPDIFKIAIAGAPVVQWDLYDTGYTERYMELPETNPHGYSMGSVTSYVDNFPDEDNRLLIIHGLIDENVHFQHTSALVNALVKACKPYHLQVYPNERHGIRNHDASEHYKTLVLSFLQQHL